MKKNYTVSFSEDELEAIVDLLSDARWAHHQFPVYERLYLRLAEIIEDDE